ncbi:MAG: hypothetical protein GEU90_22215 [Gemmatimonas sp.]|nr:hypothetical protein [Gemmatimonas sp.]
MTFKSAQEAHDALDEKIREARGALKDLQREVRVAREQTRREVMDQIHRELTRQLGLLSEATKQQMDVSVAKVIREFEKLGKILKGETSGQRRAGKSSIPELIEEMSDDAADDRD